MRALITLSLSLMSLSLFATSTLSDHEFGTIETLNDGVVTCHIYVAKTFSSVSDIDCGASGKRVNLDKANSKTFKLELGHVERTIHETSICYSLKAKTGDVTGGMSCIFNQ